MLISESVPRRKVIATALNPLNLLGFRRTVPLATLYSGISRKVRRVKFFQYLRIFEMVNLLMVFGAFRNPIDLSGVR